VILEGFPAKARPVSGLHDVRGRVLRRITVELLDA